MKQSRVHDWENPAVLSINRRSSHVPLRSHLHRDSALSYFLKTSAHTDHEGRVKLLSGCVWNFRLFPHPLAVPEDFSSPGFDCSKEWGKVRSVRCLSARLQTQATSSLQDHTWRVHMIMQAYNIGTCSACVPLQACSSQGYLQDVASGLTLGRNPGTLTHLLVLFQPHSVLAAASSVGLTQSP